MDYVFLYAVCADRNGMIPPYDFVSDFVSNFVLIEFSFKGFKKICSSQIESFLFFLFSYILYVLEEGS